MLVVLVLLWNQIGLAALAGAFLMLLLLPIQLWMSQRIKVHRQNCARVTDKRVRLMSEILTGIRIVKLYNWHEPLSERIRSMRAEEVHHLYWSNFFKAMNLIFLFIWSVLHREREGLIVLAFLSS